MQAFLEVWGTQGPKLVALESDRITVGRDSSSDIPIEGDRTVSELHAVMERYGTGWSVRDMGSSNGTFVNGERIGSERRLRSGDEIRVGQSRLVFRADKGSNLTTTTAAEGPPELTRREREVLVALCRPMLGGDVFTEPASIKQLAEELVVTEAAIKNHLVNLYDKFGLHETGESRRVRLANDAIRRRAVTLADLRARG